MTKFHKASQKTTKTGTCPTVLEIILSCFHQVRLNFIVENCCGLLFYLGFGLGDSKKLGPYNDHDSLKAAMIP